MSSTGNTNPGNFANRPKEEVSEIAKKGGESSHQGGFASMDPDKQVRIPPHHHPLAQLITTSTIEGNCFDGRSSVKRILREGQ